MPTPPASSLPCCTLSAHLMLCDVWPLVSPYYRRGEKEQDTDTPSPFVDKAKWEGERMLGEPGVGSRGDFLELKS